MARIDWVDALLREWAAWLKEGEACGYAAMSPLHQDWMPPSPGTTPTLRVAPVGQARRTDQVLRAMVAAGDLSQRQVETLVAVYVLALPLDQQAERLHCQPDTIGARVRALHALLAGVLRN